MAKTKIPGGYIADNAITGDHIADNVITSAMLHTSFTVSSSNLSSIDTDNVSEGASNLYFTNARARGAISVSGNALSYNSSTGVLTASYEETPVFTGSITVGDSHTIGDDANDNLEIASSTGENILINSANQVYLQTGGTTKLETTSTGIDVTGVITTDGLTTSENINFGDGDKAVFGAGNDLQVFHDSLNSYIVDSGTGNLYIEGTNLILRADDESRYLQAVDGASGYTALYHPATDGQKLVTTSTGIDVTGNIVVSGTVDGRDLATDGTKLDGIEANATADQTQSEINALGITATGLSGTPNITVGTLQATSFSDGTISGVTFIDEDSFATNSATRVPTQQSVKAYVDAEVAGIVDSAPGTLNTLNELAAALGDDANFSTTVTNSIATKLPLAGGTMTGALNMGSQNITNAGGIGSGPITITTGAVPLSFVESGHTGNGQYWRMPLDGGNLRFDVSTSGGASFTTYDEVFRLSSDGSINVQGAQMFDTSGNINTTKTIDSGAITSTGTSTFGVSNIKDSSNPLIYFKDGSNVIEGGIGFGSVTDGLFRIAVGSSGLNTNTVMTINSSGNAVFDGTISSGAITASGAITSTSGISRFQGGLAVGGDNDIYFYQSATNVATIRTGTTGAYKYFTFESGGNLNLLSGGLEIGSQEVIQAGTRNLTNIGTISSGKITANTGDASAQPLTIGSSASTNYTLQNWITSAHSGTSAYMIAYGASHGSQANHFAMKNLASGGEIFFELFGVEPLRLTSTGATFAGTIVSNASSGITINTSDATYAKIKQDFSSADILELTSFGSMQFAIDSNNNSSNKYFIWKDGGEGTGGTEYMSLSDGGDLSVAGNILLTGTATTSSQGRMIDFTGFDKEGVTDFTDRAYIQHATNTGGHSGSVLVLSSQNDANDGIAFLTNASSNLKHNSNVIWTAGNDGSGSGLDADTLDTYHASSFPIKGSTTANTPSNITTFTSNNTLPNANGNQSGLQIYQDTSGADAFLTFHIANDYAAYFGLDGGTNDLAFGGWSAGANSYRVWHEGNDGSGSGLDADTVDGIQGANFVRSDTSDSMAGTLTLNSGGTNTYGRIRGYENDNHFIVIRGSVATGQSTLSITGDHRTTFCEHANESDEGWYFISKADGNYTEKARIDGTGQMYIGGNKVWHAGNDGSGSGLAADSLDGISSGSFLRSDANDTCSGLITFTQDISVGSQTGTWITSDVMSDAIGWNNSYGVYIGSDIGGTHYLRGNGTFTTGGSTYNLWHQGNDGSGSGLDADTLDGVQASNFLRSNVADTATQAITFSGGIVVDGSIDSGGSDYGFYQSAGTNIILKGDASGRSGIFFQSEKNGTNINHPSDYGFIQFHSYGYGGSSGEAIDMVIGTANDSTDHLILQTPYTTGLKFGYRNATSGTGLTQVNIWHAANDGSGSGLDADTVDGQHLGTSAAVGFDHLNLGGATGDDGEDLKVGGIRGNFSNQLIHMYERVNIGYPSGWGGQSAPQYGLSTYGGASLATTTGNVAVGSGTASVKFHAFATGANSQFYFQSPTPIIRGVDSNLTTRYWEIGGENGSCNIAVDPGNAQGSSTFGVTIDGQQALYIDSDDRNYVNTTTNPTANNATGHLNVLADLGDGVNIKHTVNGNNIINIWQTGGNQCNALAFYKGNSQTLRGRITLDDLAANGVSYVTSSDYRLKENIVPLPNATTRLMAMNPVQFDWIESGGTAEGFIAHELAEQYPGAVVGEKDAVFGNGDINPQGVDYGRITPLLVKTIQEQQALIESLQTRIEALEGE